MKRWLLILLLLAAPVQAVEPDEILADPALEARARSLSQGLRCMVCRNENIDDSDANLARDLRLLLRERLVAGDSDEEAIAYIVERYGEYVLLKPTTGGFNWLLWGAGPLMLVLGLAIAALYQRRRVAAAGETALTSAEQEDLRRILDE